MALANDGMLASTLDRFTAYGTPWRVSVDPTDDDIAALLGGTACPHCQHDTNDSSEETRMTDTAPTEGATGTGLSAQSAPRGVAVGELVEYALSEGDVAAINAAEPTGNGRNAARTGQYYAAVVVATFGPTTANLRVLLDGAGLGAEFWATSRTRGTEPAQWRPLPR